MRLLLKRLLLKKLLLKMAKVAINHFLVVSHAGKVKVKLNAVLKGKDADLLKIDVI